MQVCCENDFEGEFGVVCPETIEPFVVSGCEIFQDTLLYRWVRDEDFFIDKLWSDAFADLRRRWFVGLNQDHSKERVYAYIKNSLWTVYYNSEENRAIGVGPKKYYLDTLLGALGLAYLRATTYSFSLLLHAAAILIDGQCIIFCGESGSGKTTLALNAKREGFPVLSDDKVIVRCDGGDRLVAYGTPFGKICDVPVSHPVVGIGFLGKSETNTAEGLSRKEAFLKLWEEEFYHRYRFLRRGFARSLFEQIYNLTHSLPCFVLKFRKDFHDWELVCKAVYGSK